MCPSSVPIIVYLNHLFGTKKNHFTLNFLAVSSPGIGGLGLLLSYSLKLRLIECGYAFFQFNPLLLYLVGFAHFFRHRFIYIEYCKVLH